MYVVAGEGVEPSRGCPPRILSPVRLPISPPGQGDFWERGTFLSFSSVPPLSVVAKEPLERYGGSDGSHHCDCE